MRADLRCLLLSVVAVFVIAAPAAAETYTITLVGGQTLQTRYQPQEASFSPEIVMLLSEVGNWIAIPRGDIQRVEAETETRGFGRVIDTTTIDLGLAPNDTPVPDPSGGTSQADMLRAILDQQRGPAPSYDQPQFVSPSRAGGGLPVSYATGGSFGGGGGGVSVVVPPSAGAPPQQ